jgi:FkbM family methyltransferase
MSYPFVLWTLQRTGGTLLAELLMQASDHPPAEHEPFNWARDKPRQFWPIVEAWTASRDRVALLKDLEALAARRFLIKHCYELFPLAFNVALIEATAKAGYRHILLRRLDEGGRLVSKFIAETQGTWFADYGREVYAEVKQARRELQPLPVDQMVAQYHHARHGTAALRRAFEERGVSVLETTYEDLYRSEPVLRAQHIATLLEALDVRPEARASATAAFLDKARQGGQQTFSVLSYVPNIEEVVEGLAAAGCPAPADHMQRRRLMQLKAQLSRHASARGWIMADNLDRDWPGYSLRFDQSSSLEFRVESADMAFANVYYGIKNARPIHNKSLDEALTLALGKADYSETWPWCRHPDPEDDILPIAANWALDGWFAGAVEDGSLASRLVAAAEIFRNVLGASGYLAIGASEWGRLQDQGASDAMPAPAAVPGPPLRSPSLFQAPYLAELGLMADIIIDAGVRTGTPQLYRAFPERLFVLVDPQRGGEALLDLRPDHYRFVNKALGARQGHALLSDEGAKSSLCERTPLTSSGAAASYEVEVTTLDDLLDDLPAAGQVGLKLDTEGYEIEIMAGLDRHLDRVEFVICEASIRKRFINGYHFSDLVALMRDKGLFFYNVLSRPQRHPLFYDVLFLKAGHSLFN